MSQFNPNTQLPVGVPQAQGIAPAQQVQPQVGVDGQQAQPGDQSVNPNVPQVQELPEINPAQFSIDGLETVVDPRVADHIRRQHEANLQYNVGRLQQVKDREIAMLRQQLQTVQQSYHQYAVQVDPTNAEYLEAARREAEYQEQLEFYRQQAVEGQRYQALNKIVSDFGGQVRFEDLQEARNIHEARAIAAQIAAARQRVPQVPQNQMHGAGPSGGYGQAFEQPPVPGSQVWDNVWAHRAGREMPHRDQESVVAARRYLQQQGG